MERRATMLFAPRDEEGRLGEERLLFVLYYLGKQTHPGVSVSAVRRGNRDADGCGFDTTSVGA